MKFFLKHLPAAFRFSLAIVTSWLSGYAMGRNDKIEADQPAKFGAYLHARSEGYYAALKSMEERIRRREEEESKRTAATVVNNFVTAVGSSGGYRIGPPSALVGITIAGNTFTATAPQAEEQLAPAIPDEKRRIIIRRLNGDWLLVATQFRATPNSPWRYEAIISEDSGKKYVTVYEVESQRAAASLWQVARLFEDMALANEPPETPAGSRQR